MLDYFVFQFYGDSASRNISAFDKQKLLLKLKYEDKATKDWNNIKFGNYLYHLFPDASKLGKENQPANEEVKLEEVISAPSKQVEPKFPKATTMQIVKYRSRKSIRETSSISKIDYVKKQKANINIGELGEREVIEYEKKRLESYPDLQRKIQWQSQKSDAIGYDILSFEKDGTPRQIEVKSTTDESSDTFSFIMTENERLHAIALPNYWIYRVFDVNGQPMIYKI